MNILASPKWAQNLHAQVSMRSSELKSLGGQLNHSSRSIVGRLISNEVRENLTLVGRRATGGIFSLRSQKRDGLVAIKHTYHRKHQSVHEKLSYTESTGEVHGMSRSIVERKRA